MRKTSPELDVKARQGRFVEKGLFCDKRLDGVLSGGKLDKEMCFEGIIFEDF